jgi:hypothetical protein
MAWQVVNSSRRVWNIVADRHNRATDRNAKNAAFPRQKIEPLLDRKIKKSQEPKPEFGLTAAGNR